MSTPIQSMAATEQYRCGWDAVFGRQRPTAESANEPVARELETMAAKVRDGQVTAFLLEWDGDGAVRGRTESR